MTADSSFVAPLINNPYLRHLRHDSVRGEDVDRPGAAHPHQLRHGVEEREAGVRQVVYQDDLQYISSLTVWQMPQWFLA